MKRFFACILILCLLTACSGYLPDDTASYFKLTNVASITLRSPNNLTNEGTSIELKPGQAHYTQLVELIQGEKLDTCPTNDDFLECVIDYTINTGDVVKVYIDLDGTNYVSLFSVNPAVAKYLELPQEDMAKIREILKSHGIESI